jgi:hypothetical protein
MIATRISATNISGKDQVRSTIIVTAVSNLPPKYPAAAPSTMPQKTEMPMAIDDTDSDVRAP